MKVHKGKRVFALLIAVAMLASQVTSAYAIDVVNIEETEISEVTVAPEVTGPPESQPPDSSGEAQETTVESEETSGVDETPPPIESEETQETTATPPVESEEAEDTTSAPPVESGESEETTTVESEETTIGSSTVNIRPRPNRPQIGSDRVSANGEVNTAGGTANSDLSLKVSEGGSVDPDDPILFSAVVPVKLPVSMDLEGNITVPTNAIIVNKVDTKGIAVTDISIDLDPDWNAANYDDDFSAKQDDSKDIAIKLRSDKLQGDGSFTITSDDWKIPKASTIKLDMGIKIPKQTQLGNIGNIASIQYTLDWSGDDTTTGNGEGGSSWNGNATGEIPTPDPKPEPDPGDTELTVTFVASEGGSIQGDAEIKVESNGTVTFPTPVPKNAAYEFDKWVNSATGETVTDSIKVTEDISIQAVFRLKDVSDPSWFTVDTSGNLTGFTDAYANLSYAPTDLVLPRQVGGVQVTGIADEAFAGRSALTSVVLPSTLRSMGERVFKDCSSLQSVVLPVGLDSINIGTFLNCTSLSEVEIPTGVAVVHSKAFEGCSNLTDVIMPESLVEIGDSAFAGCGNLDVELPQTLKTIGAEAFKDCASLSSVDIANDASVGNNAFSGCTSLSLTADSCKNYMDWSPWGLEDNQITWLQVSPEWDTNPLCKQTGEELYAVTVNSRTETASIVLKNKSGLTHIEVPTSIGGKKITELGKECFVRSTLTSITLPPALEIIGDTAFYSCGALKKIVIPESVINIYQGAFANTGITDITFKGDHNSNLIYFGARAFQGLKAERFIVNRPVLGLGDYCFNDSSTKEIRLYGNPAESSGSIGQYAFDGCYKLETLVLPEGVTTIKYYAFSECSLLKTINIPSTVRYIENNIFGMHSKKQTPIETITIPTSVIQIASSALAFESLKEVIVNKPSGSLSGAPWGASNATVKWVG